MPRKFSYADYWDDRGLDRPSSYRDMVYGTAQQYAGPGEDALARSSASAIEDEMLRGLLGSRKKLKEGESAGPSGSYALAKYPELWKAVTWAATGNLPGGGGSSEKMWLKEAQDRDLQERNSQKRKQWAAQQSRLLGGRY
jgi:hypothetical protein